MADIESNVKVNIDTSDALAQLKLLQNQISVFQQAMRKAGAANAASAAQLQQNLVNSINASGKFNASIQTIQTSAERFTGALEKNKLTMGEYFRYAGGASKTFGKLFKTEFDTINSVARERVKDLQTQYIKLGRDASGAMKAISIRPTTLDMENLGTQTQITAQRQQLFNQLMKQGSTQLLNFGKNTQWAGRQLMVGFTIPLTLMGTAAAKAYTEIEKASIAFKRVYGDMNTTASETNKMANEIRNLASEYTKYGVAVADTMDMAAKAAAMGKTGTDLLAQVNQAAKLAVLGQVDQQQALETTMSLTNAFGSSTEELAGKIDFLNAVENQTVTSIEDLTIAIPKAAPVIRQLGGDVEDLTFFLTAMKEGGINASEGANALKSGLASMINPTKQASNFLAGFGINVKAIVEGNRGDVRGTVLDMARAFDTLDPLNRARAIEQMFGKFQFSRISTLFQNVIKEGSQAQTVASLANQTAEELAVLSEREMNKISDSPLFKFEKSIKDIQAKLAPVGEAFLKAITPIMDFVGKVLDGFNSLGDGTKQFIGMLTLAVAGVGPILLMTFGLIANGVANIMKLFTNIKGFINKTTKPSDILGEQTGYMNSEQIKGAAIAASLDQAHSKLRQTFTSEAAAVNQLTAAYRSAVQAQQAYSGIPGVPVGNPNALPVAGTQMQPRKYANGVSMVPGPRGAGDIVPALLSPGEAVIPAKHAQKYAPVIAGMVAGNLPGFEDGTTGAGMRQSTYGPLTQKQTDGLARTGLQLKEISDEVMAGPYANVPPTDFGTQISPTSGHSFPAFSVGGIYQKPDGTKVFVKPQMDLTSALAEVRGTTIARDTHGLVAPKQEIRVMMDPTDPDGLRKFIVLESALDEKIANIPTKFTDNQYFKQLVASLLRGDKDLGVGNLGGDVLADVGTAGVFGRASGKRALGSAINSMEEQAIINLLGVKGGAKRFFAEATSEQVSKMNPAAYDAAMKAEIQAVIPKLQNTIAGFGNLSPEEKAAYQSMQERLQAGLSVDWAKYQIMHSAVPPKKFEDGGFAGLTQASHTQKELDKNDPAVRAQIEAIYPGLKDEHLQYITVLGNLTADLPTWVNQRLIPGKGGIVPPIFQKVWNSINGKFNSSARAAGVPANLNNTLAQIENTIGSTTVKIAGARNVVDPILADGTKEALFSSVSKGGDYAQVANRLIERSNTVGSIRADLGKNADGKLRELLATGIAEFAPNGKDVVFAGTKIKIGRFALASSSSKPEKRAGQEKARASWIASGAAPSELPKDLKLRGSSIPPGSFRRSLTGISSYDELLASITSVSDPTVFDEKAFMSAQGFEQGTEGVGGVRSGKPKASVFDIDDTLLDLSSFMAAHKAENDKLPEDQKKKWYKEVAKNPKGIPAGLAALKAAQERGNKILLMTARPDFYEPYTMETLQKLGIDMNGVKVIARRDKDYRKPEQMKYDKTSAYMKYYDIEEFYDDMPATRAAISLLGINTMNPLKLSEGTPGIGYDIAQDVDLSTLGMDKFDEDKVGTTPGGFRMINGKKHYVKKGYSPAETTSEVLSSALFSAMGNRGPQLKMLDRDVVASEIIPGLIPSTRAALAEWIGKQPDKQAAAKVVATALKRYIDTDVPFNAAIGNIDTHANNILFNPATSKFENIDLGNSVLAGFTNFDDFQSMAESDTMRMKDDVFGAIRETLGQAAVNRLASEAGITRTVTGKKNSRDNNAEIDRLAQILGFDLNKTSGTDPATNPKVNPFIKKMIEENPSLAGTLDFGRQTSTSGKTLGDSLKTLFTRMKRAKARGGTHFFANGVFSVPGPKGAGDVVPAMLSPGEAVIPARQAEQHRGLISSMISGNLPGYRNGSVSIPGYKSGVASVPGFQDGGFVKLEFSEARPLPVIIMEDLSEGESPSTPVSPEEGPKEPTPSKGDDEKTGPKHRKDTMGEKLMAGLKKSFERSEFTGKVQGGMYGASAIAASASMIPKDIPVLGKVGEAAQSMVGPIGAATAAMSAVPGPAGLVVGALAAGFVAYQQVTAHLNKLRDESFKLTKAMGSGNGAIQKFAEFAKKVSGTEVMDKQRAASAGNFYNIVPGKKTFGESYMETDAGKELVKNVDTAIGKGGIDKAKDLITNQLSTAIAAGVMTPKQARSIANNLGAQLGDMTFGLEVSGRLTDLIGPNGENLTNDPLQVAMVIKQESLEEFKDVLSENSTLQIGFSSGAASQVAKGVTALSTGNLGGALVDFIFGGMKYQEGVAAAAGEIAAGIGNTLELQQQMVDSLDVAYQRRIASALAAGDEAEAIRLQNQYLIDQEKLMDSNAEDRTVMYDQLRGLDSGVLTSTKDKAIEGIGKAYEGKGMETQVALAESQIKNMKGDDAQKAVIASAVASKQMSFKQLETAAEVFGTTEEGAATLEKLLKSSPVEANRALDIASGLSGKAKDDYVASLSTLSEDPEKLKEQNDAIEMARKTTGVFYGDKETATVMLNYAVQNPEKMVEFKKNIDGLKKEKKITTDIVAKYVSPKVADVVKNHKKQFEKYSNAERIVFTTEVQAIMELEGNPAMIKAYEAWVAEGNTGTFGDYAAYQGDRAVTTQTADTTGNNNKKSEAPKAPDPSMLDPYVKALREASNWQQKLTTGWNASLKALQAYTSKGIATMAGGAVLLQQYGADANFIEAFMGGTEAEQNKIINRTTGKITKTGKFLIAQLKKIEDAKIGMAYILMSPAERLAKDNELYSAGLEVIGGKEKKINDAYEKRFKALDEVSKVQDKINASQQTELDLADALSKGDIAAAARIALKAKQEQSKQALADARTNLENQKAEELSNIQVIINGQLMTRAEIEAQIAGNAEKIAAFKLLEEQRQANIARSALAAAQASATSLANGRALANLPGSNGSGNGNNNNSNNNNNDNDAGAKPTRDAGVGKTWTLVNNKWAATTVAQPTYQQYIGGGTYVQAVDSNVVWDTDTDTWVKPPTTRGTFYGQVNGLWTWNGSSWVDSKKFVPRSGMAVPGSGNQNVYLASGGLIPKYFASGGVSNPFSRGTDTIPAMLSPGEFVIQRSAVDKIGAETLNAINNGSTQIGESVYNYSVTLNVSSTSDSSDIADKVLQQIKRLDSQRIRSSVI